MFGRLISRREARGFQVQTEAEQTRTPERLGADPADVEAATPALSAAPKLRKRPLTSRHAVRQVCGGILREQCGGGYRVRRVSSSY